VSRAIIGTPAPIQHLVHTLTADNGKEFAEHEIIAIACKADFYFTEPYASWQRGSNENGNGLVRSPAQGHRLRDSQCRVTARYRAQDQQPAAKDASLARPLRGLRRSPQEACCDSELNPPTALAKQTGAQGRPFA
jgi:hypothetical protein